MDIAARLDWWLKQEGPDNVPVIEIGVAGEVRSLREDIAAAADEIERLVVALNTLSAQGSGTVGSTDRADCLAAFAGSAIARYRVEQSLPES